jgi:hypothetical protein
VEDKIVYSKRIKAGKRTYFIDIKSTSTDDFYITVTESKRKLRPGGDFFFEKHKIFLYKEDFNKFLAGINSAVDYVKTELLPDYDFSKFDNAREDAATDGAENNETDETRLKWE